MTFVKFLRHAFAAVLVSAGSVSGFAQAVFENIPAEHLRQIESMEAQPPIQIHPFSTTGPTGYSPAIVRDAYGITSLINGGNTGAGQKIGIVVAYGSSTIQKDLDKFCSTFGIPSTTIQIGYPVGTPRQSDSGWAMETTLDVEWAHATAPGATIVLEVVPTAALSSLLSGVTAAVNAGASQVSMSWGSSEFSGEKSFDYVFLPAGVSFFCASGDSGAGASWPAASPYVTGVGGTTLNHNTKTGTYSEVAWSGSGGGKSAYESRPSYQNGWHTATGRGIPDVSFVANPNTGVSICYTSGGKQVWTVVGGTSAGSPQWAGIAALVNARRKTVGKTPISHITTSLYTAASSAYSADFYDVTSGNDGGYNAGLKYDFVTGLGSPHVAALFSTLVAQ